MNWATSYYRVFRPTSKFSVASPSFPIFNSRHRSSLPSAPIKSSPLSYSYKQPRRCFAAEAQQSLKTSNPVIPTIPQQKESSIQTNNLDEESLIRTGGILPVPLEQLKSLSELSFAVVHVGGTQYKLLPGDVIMTQKIDGVNIGQDILLQKVLLIGTKEWTAIGTPLLPSARVHAIVEEQTLTAKTVIFKKKRRKNYVRHRGHRQPFTTLRIKSILFDKEDFFASKEYMDGKTESAGILVDNALLPKAPRPQREWPLPPMLSATDIEGPVPYPSTLAPLPNWDPNGKKINTKVKLRRADPSAPQVAPKGPYIPKTKFDGLNGESVFQQAIDMQRYREKVERDKKNRLYRKPEEPVDPNQKK